MFHKILFTNANLVSHFYGMNQDFQDFKNMYFSRFKIELG